MPRVSVIIPCFNSAQTIERALTSVAAQTKAVDVVFVVDDASHDNTLDVIRAFQSSHDLPLHIIELSENSGPSIARNTAWDVAETDFIAFLDADDVWHPQKWEIVADWLERNPQSVFCSHLMHQQDGDWMTYPSSGPSVSTYSFNDLLIATRFSTPTVVMRTDISCRFPEYQDCAEDYALWLAVAHKYGQLHRINWYLARYFKSAYGQQGLSADLWAMEQGVQRTYLSLARAGTIGTSKAWALRIFSFMKLVNRFGVVMARMVLSRIKRNVRA